MKILLLAPHPFYQERGTPIAVNLLVRTLSQRGDEIDILTYGEGEDVSYPNVTIRRTAGIVRGVRPGFSFRKVVADIMMAGVAVRMASRKRYDIVHAVEESAFIGMILNSVFRLPYIYDMDSSLAQQMTEKMPYLKPLSPVMRRLEGSAVKGSHAVVAVCQALVETARSYDEEKQICLLHDVANDEKPIEDGTVVNLREATGASGPILLYVGNLEPYQGIDLILESIAVNIEEIASTQARLVIIGGLQKDIEAYRDKCGHLGIGDTVHFLGPKPLSHLSAYLCQADILLSPRTKGINTPMKIYAYLQAGKPILATSIYSHTQVLDSSIALLAAPEPAPFAKALEELLKNPQLRASLGSAGKRRVKERYSYEAYKKHLYDFYHGLESDLTAKAAAVVENQK